MKEESKNLNEILQKLNTKLIFEFSRDCCNKLKIMENMLDKPIIWGKG